MFIISFCDIIIKRTFGDYIKILFRHLKKKKKRVRDDESQSEKVDRSIFNKTWTLQIVNVYQEEGEIRIRINGQVRE